MTFPSDRTEWLGVIVILLSLLFVAVVLWEILQKSPKFAASKCYQSPVRRSLRQRPPRLLKPQALSDIFLTGVFFLLVLVFGEFLSFSFEPIKVCILPSLMAELELMSQVQRIEDELFESKKHAERHGIELCMEWIDDNQFGV